MTREVAIDNLKADIKYWENTSVSTEHLYMAIEALEQEPCDDCVSRQAVLNKAFEVKTGKNTSAMVVYAEDIRKELPVKPKCNPNKNVKTYYFHNDDYCPKEVR